MTQFMFQAGQLKFKPYLSDNLLQILKDIANEYNFFIVSKQKLDMNDIEFNWLPKKVNKNLVKILNKLRGHRIKVTGQFLVLVKSEDGKLALFKYLPKYCSIRAIRGYFRIVRVYPLNGSRAVKHRNNNDIPLSPQEEIE